MILKNLQKLQSVPTPKLRKILRFLLNELEFPEVDFDLTLVDDPQIHALNLRFRNQDKPTDVLSFPLYEREEARKGHVFLGDVVISVPTTLRQAARLKKAFLEELVFLSIHGILHLLGYDHETHQKDAREMRRLEKKLFLRVREEFGFEEV